MFLKEQRWNYNRNNKYVASVRHILMLTSDAHMSLYIWTQIEEIQYVSTIFLQIFQTDMSKKLVFYNIFKNHQNSYFVLYMGGFK